MAAKRFDEWQRELEQTIAKLKTEKDSERRYVLLREMSRLLARAIAFWKRLSSRLSRPGSREYHSGPSWVKAWERSYTLRPLPRRIRESRLALIVPPRLPQWNARVTYTVERTVLGRHPFSGLAEQFSELVEHMFQHGEPRSSLRQS
jgi:hypothetical protein